MKHARPDYDERIQDSAAQVPGTEPAEGEEVPKHIPVDEPVFLIRGQDPNAPEAVRDYARRALFIGADSEFVERCEEQAAAMEQWQADHPENVHTPDL